MELFINHSRSTPQAVKESEVIFRKNYKYGLWSDINTYYNYKWIFSQIPTNVIYATLRICIKKNLEHGIINFSIQLNRLKPHGDGDLQGCSNGRDSGSTMRTGSVFDTEQDCADATGRWREIHGCSGLTLHFSNARRCYRTSGCAASPEWRRVFVRASISARMSN